MVFPDNAKFDFVEHMIRWFDHYLKGVDNGVEKDAPVRYYVMGAMGEPDGPGNLWRSTTNWPLRTFSRLYYFHEGGKLISTSPTMAASATSYISDPLNPAKIPYTSFPGARNAQDFETQTNVLTFTTEPLKTAEEWTGKVAAEIYVSSTAKDSDFIVRLTDVYPDGRSILIMDMIRRGRYREGFEHENLLEAGKVYKLTFDVGWLSQSFNKGHRIRITVASMGAPFYEPNPQTGEPFTLDFPSNAVVATNSIYHNRNYASRIIAPIPQDLTPAIGITRPKPKTAPPTGTRPGVAPVAPAAPGAVPARKTTTN